MALIRLDLPALRLPKIPMWIRSAAGVVFNDIVGSPFYVDEIVIITWYIKAKIYEYGNGMSRKE